MLHISHLALFYPFFPTGSFAIPRGERPRRASLGAYAGTIGMLDTFRRIYTTPPSAAAGESIRIISVDSLINLGAPAPPRRRALTPTAIPRPNCQTAGATLPHHKHAPDPHASCRLFVNLYMIPIAEC
jgi:hypothetical protein